MKRNLLLTLFCFMALVANAFDVNGLAYNVVGRTTICAGRAVGSKQKDIVVPATVVYEGKRYPVTSIREGAFAETNITSVVLSDAIRTIGDGAFTHCAYLSSVTLGNNLRTIKRSLFEDCRNLTSVTLSQRLEHIEQNAFAYCSRLADIKFPASLQTIGANAFAQCTALRSIALPAKVTTIGSRAFYDCVSVKSIHLGQSVETIGDYAFANCSNNTYVYIGGAVKHVGREAFAGNDIWSVYLLSVMPPSSGSLPFDFTQRAVHLYVPASSLALYQTHPTWRRYKVLGFDEGDGVYEAAQSVKLTKYKMAGRRKDTNIVEK